MLADLLRMEPTAEHQVFFQQKHSINQMNAVVESAIADQRIMFSM